jgi:MFS family permease
VATEHCTAIHDAIQLAIAPVFLLTSIAAFINALIGRLGRAVDRRRLLEDDVLPKLEGEEREDKLAELRLVERRVHLVLWSIALAVLSALLVCLLIGVAFGAAFVTLDLARAIAGLFIGAVLALTGCLMLFMHEITLAGLALHPKFWPQRGAARVERRNTTDEAK